MTTGIIHDQNLEKQIEKQMGCMAGFFQLFDRHQILAGKRLCSTKRLTSTAAVDSTAESEKSNGSLAVSVETEKPQQTRPIASPSPDRMKASPLVEPRSPAAEVVTSAEKTGKSPLPLPVFEFKEGTRSSWKFSKEAPRLSLDSRATVDAKGSLYPREIRTNAATPSVNRRENFDDGATVDGDDKRRSPSVIARLMGLERLPESSAEPMKKAELRRSASESRVSRDLFPNRFIDGIESTSNSFNLRPLDTKEYSGRNARTEPPKPSYRTAGSSTWKSSQQRKSFFDSEDLFPEPKQTVSIFGEIEKRLKMRGIDEPTKDLETLKQILEALQLKGLLHSKKSSEHVRQRNFVYEQSFSSDESPIVVIKPSRLPVLPINRSFMNDSSPAIVRNRASVRRNLSNTIDNLPSVSPRRERPEINRNERNQLRARNSSSPTRRENNAKSPNSPGRRRPLSVETQRKASESIEQRRASPVHSPKFSPRRCGSDQTIASRSPRNRKPVVDIDPKDKITIPMVGEDELSSISEGSVSTSSQTDTERSKMEEYKGGRTLLERCDKLLHSIAEMTGTELQPSPVSVLDSSFYKDESSPSPVKKRTIDFKDQLGEFEEEIWSPAFSPIQSKCEEKSDDCDLDYICDILRASNYLPEDSDVFLLLEKQQYLKGKDTSKVSRLKRKLIFDIIAEILDRNRQLPPWKVLSRPNSSTSPSLPQIWSEFQRIRERDAAEDLFDVICGVLRKDLAGDAFNGWEDCPVEMSEAVLDIERLIFKDLVGETIRDLATVAANYTTVSAPRRKLVF
ncbi:protein LONGIFOLIA 1 isoform X2 [Diospyros lotus]|uniref:protein LONGIFOLIA 1 isoform X2 n=1 Tax=Diospyros lotus TaxID=55363 RepID=UPI002256D437|nr:protein LONGIFOLIA 1 isoform X2 [Diospyros lotus]